MELKKYYCLKNFDIDLEGYAAAENFTTLIIHIKKCVSETKDHRPCKSETEINNALNKRDLIIFTEDFDLTPNDYKRPVKEKITTNNCPIRLDQVQTFVGYYQLTNMQTENNLFGFEVFSDIKSEKYIIYHSALIIAYEVVPGDPSVMNYNIILKDNTVTNLRTYTQLVEVLGDVGGLMEVIHSIFGVICALVADILYDKTMVNNLFTFNLNNFSVRIRNKPKLNINKLSKVKTPYLNKEKYEIKIDKIPIDFSKNNLMKSSEIKKSRLKKSSILDCKTYIIHNNSNNEKTTNSKNVSSTRMLKKSIFNQPELYKENNDSEINYEEIKIYNYKSPVEDKIFDKRKIIKKIETNIFCTYFCFCIVRKRENFGNALLDEAMNIITEKLDIFNMFRDFYFIDDLKEKSNYEYINFEMSDECKSKLSAVSNKIMNSFYRI